MANIGEEKGWTFDAFDPGTLRKLPCSFQVVEECTILHA